MTGIVAIIIMILRFTTTSPSLFLKGGNLMQHRSYFVQILLIMSYVITCVVCIILNTRR